MIQLNVKQNASAHMNHNNDLCLHDNNENAAKHYQANIIDHTPTAEMVGIMLCNYDFVQRKCYRSIMDFTIL